MAPSPRRPLSAALAALAITGGLMPFLDPGRAAAATGLTCPAGTVAEDFFWERADGSGAQWPASSATAATTVANSGYSLTYPVGSSGVHLTATITDPANRSEDGDNPLTAANAGITPKWPNPLFTRTNGAYGADDLTVVMNSARADETVSFDFAFDRPVLIPQFEIGDIDFAGTDSGGNDPVHDSYQDEVALRAERGDTPVAFDFEQGSPSTGRPLITGTDRVAGGPFDRSAVGNLASTDPQGIAILRARSPITSFGFDYSNGPDDEANDPPASGIPGVPDGSIGVSNSQAIRVSSFTVCVGTQKIGDLVFADLDGDGVQDPGEPGLGGVTVNLTDTDGNPMGTTVTDANGAYLFDDLPPGIDYVVDPDESTLPGGSWTPSGDLFSGDGANDGASVVPLPVGSPDVADADFGYAPELGMISGSVRLDPEADAVAGPQDSPLAGVTVELLDDAGTVVATTTTDVDGGYSFGGLVPGTYTVRETTPSAYADGGDVPGTNGATATGNDLTTVTLDWGDSSTDNDFFEVPAALSGTVFVDDDRDGAIDGDEPERVGGVAVILLDADGVEVARTATAPDGTYRFDGLAAGDYTVVEEQPDGYGSTTPNRLDVSVPTTGLADVDFGEDLGSIGDTVFLDADGDGIQDAGEQGVGGVPVHLLDAAGRVLATTTTDADGHYVFEHLWPDTYLVEVDAPDGFGLTRPNVGDDAADSDPSWLTGRTEPITLDVAADGLVDRRTDVDAGLVEEVVDLAVDGHVSDDVVAIGDEVTYTFVASNDGTVPVGGGALVTVTLPDSVRPDAVEAPGWDVVIDGQTVTLTRPEPILPGEDLPLIVVDATVVDDQGPLEATVDIETLDGQPETTLGNNHDALAVEVVDPPSPTPSPVMPSIPGLPGLPDVDWSPILAWLTGQHPTQAGHHGRPVYGVPMPAVVPSAVRSVPTVVRGALPRTGADAVPLAVAGVGLIAGGAVIRPRRRRRR